MAIAAFLDIEVLPFQERGVKSEDGILRFIQANCAQFSDRHLLPDVVSEKVREQKWSPSWRNELELVREREEYDQLGVRPDGRKARFYHIKVCNQHRQKVAHECVAYLEYMKNISTNEIHTFDPVEFKWKGIITSRLSIFPSSFRYLDAFHVYLDNPNTVHFRINRTIVDYSGYLDVYKLHGPGDYELNFIVLSTNFPPSRTKCKLHIDNKLNNLEFSPI